MSRAIAPGSLVVTNRKHSGQGLVVQRVKDINLLFDFDLSASFRHLYDVNHPEYRWKEKCSEYFQYWHELADLRDSIDEAAIDMLTDSSMHAEDAAALIKKFWGHNVAYSVQLNGKKVREPKIDFCLVRWYKKPSYYQNGPNLPTQRWESTRSLKKIS